MRAKRMPVLSFVLQSAMLAAFAVAIFIESVNAVSVKRSVTCARRERMARHDCRRLFSPL